MLSMTTLYLYGKHEANEFISSMEQEMKAADEKIPLLKEKMTELYADTRSEKEQREDFYILSC